MRITTSSLTTITQIFLNKMRIKRVKDKLVYIVEVIYVEYIYYIHILVNAHVHIRITHVHISVRGEAFIYKLVSNLR